VGIGTITQNPIDGGSGGYHGVTPTDADEDNDWSKNSKNWTGSEEE